MGDSMVEKVARAMFAQDHDEGWDRGEDRTKLIYINNARAALEACHFGELVEALVDMAARFERCVVANGTDKEYALLSTKDARAVLKKVEDEGHG